MKQIKNVEVLGDSILKGIQVNPDNKKYITKNDIDINMLSTKYLLSITNESKFGCTVTKGFQLIKKKLDLGMNWDMVVMDFGGNDCDYKWEHISENPSGIFEPNTPLSIFTIEYTNLIRTLKNKNIVPVLTTLPPLIPERFFDWWCQNLNKENILKWLGSVEEIYHHQALYSKRIEEIATNEQVPLVDLRSAFLKHGNLEMLICEDGTHPNSNGQKIITDAFHDFILQKRYLITP